MATTARIALLQLPAYSIEDAASSLDHTLRRIDDTAAARPDLIVLPEVTYPAYFIGEHAASTAPDAAIHVLAGRARRHRAWIAAGLAMRSPAGALVNAAALFNRAGELVGRYDKSFLWHFDARWFTPGSAYPVFETDFGRVGMLVCADGRLPEIARCLVLGGAQVILDLTAWVTTGRDIDAVTSVQREYMMPARAAENGVWVAAASKFGIEAESIVYCGRSCVIDPLGKVIAELGTNEDAALVYDVPIADASLPVIRRPALYESLTHPTESLPVIRTLDEAAVIREQDRRIAVVQVSMPPSGAEFLRLARRHAERQRLQDAGLVLFPATPGRLRTAYPHDEVLAGMQQIAAGTGLLIGFTVSEGEAGTGKRAMYLVGPRGIIGKHHQTHKPPGPRFETMPMGDVPCPVINTPVGRVGLMLAAEGNVPEVARSLMLRGAEIILWAGDDPAVAMAPIASSRADENRVFVASAAAPTATGATMIADPSGRPIAAALDGTEIAVSATVNRMLAHLKAMAPGTDVVRNRQPATYAALTRAEALAAP